MFSRDKRAREGLEELARKFAELEHKFKILAMEWEEAYEKINHSLRKLGRRAEVLQKEMDGGKPPLSPEEEALAAMHNGDPTPDNRKRAMEIVMKRRGIR